MKKLVTEMLETSASNNKPVLEMTAMVEVLANPLHTKKWPIGQENVKPKEQVLFKEDVLPQDKWPLERTVEVFPAIELFE